MDADFLIGVAHGLTIAGSIVLWIPELNPPPMKAQSTAA